MEVDSDAGGPSAGLAATLAILDVLTTGELTGGVPVAFTGTISMDGSVGPVEGVEHKARSLRRGRFAAFVVPAGAGVEARAAVPPGVSVVEVGDLDAALAALARL